MKLPGKDKSAAAETPVAPGAAPGGQPRPDGKPLYHVPHTPGTAPEEEKFDPRRYIGVIMAYWWLVLLITLLGAGGGAAYCILGTPIFRAACQYEMFSERVLEFGLTSTQEGETRRIDRQIMILQSEVLLKRVRNKLAPEWESKVSQLDPLVKVRGDRAPTVINVFVNAVDEDYAVEFLRELVSAYEDMRRVEEMTATERALRSLRLEKMRLSNELNDASERVVEFQKKHDLKMTAIRVGFDEGFLNTLLARENSLRMERAMIGTQLRALEGANAATVQDVLALTLSQGLTGSRGAQGTQPAGVAPGADAGGAPTPDMGRMTMPGAVLEGMADTRNWEMYEAALARLQARYNQQLSHYKPNHPAMGALTQEMARVKQEIDFESEIGRRRLQARFDALKVQEESLHAVIQAWKGEEPALSIEESSEYTNMQSEVTRLQNLVTILGERMIDVASKSADALVTRFVAEPRGRGQVWPKTLQIMGGSVGGALAVALALAFVFFHYDTAFTDAIAIEQKLGLPFISGIPRWERVLKHLEADQSIVMDRDKPNAASEAYRSLRTSLEKSIGEKKGYSMLLTSADAGEGKSVTTANLGVAFSWTGKRVLLVDADLRRPNLHTALGEKNASKGLTQFFLGEVTDWKEIVRPTAYENVDFIPAGRFVYEASELCSTSVLRRLMQSWAEQYDLILLDSAPVGRIVDTAMVARGCDGVLLVSLHGKSSVPAMRHALRRLEGCNVLGFCLNAIDMPRGHGYYYGGYYGYRWRYGLYSYYYYYSNSLYGYGYDYYYGKDGEDKGKTEAAAGEPEGKAPAESQEGEQAPPPEEKA